MATPSEKLASSLLALHSLQDEGKIAIHTEEISRIDRQRLLTNAFLKEVTRGWYIIARPEEKKGDTTSWYHSFWNFCARFLQEKFDKEWCISPEQSLQIHAGNWSVPTQLIVKSPQANNFKTELLFDTSLFLMRSALPVTKETIEMNGIRLLTLPSSLINCSEKTFSSHPTDARTALSMISDASGLLELLLDGGHSTIAGRLAGALRNNGQEKLADDILKTMKSAGYDVRETDPFNTKLAIRLSTREKSPYVNRIKLMWAEMREAIIQECPPAPGLPADKDAFLTTVSKIYITDAYHSLSIERYMVTPELIEKVRSGAWNYRENEADRKQRDAMAARGYWQAFQQVELSVRKVLDGQNAGRVADNDHSDWYRELFAPSVMAGLLKASDLAGYRNHQVYIGNSKHTPLNIDAVREAMPALFELLQQESEAFIRAVLGHFIFVFIHPYMDGNGRMGRFLMNVMLASGGYPWTVIPVEARDEYMHALESASVGQDIRPLARFLAYLVNKGMSGQPVANL
jgi:hypothetical protein